MTPHLICLSRDQLYSFTKFINHFTDNYYLSSSFSRINHIGDGVCIFSRADLQYTMCNVSQFCNEKTFEVCATQLDLGNSYIIIICIYRSPAGNFFNFLDQLDSTLKHLYNTRIEFIVCVFKC
jgi:hypothetical protein